MFPLDPRGLGVLEDNKFMEQEIDVEGYDMTSDTRDDLQTSKADSTGVEPASPPAIHDGLSTLSQTVSYPCRRYKVKDLSRLWQYRNGFSPPAEKMKVKPSKQNGEKQTGEKQNVTKQNGANNL